MKKKSAIKRAASTRAEAKAVKTKTSNKAATAAQVQEILAELESLATPKIRQEMGSRYGIHTDKAFGITVNVLLRMGKEIGVNHELALALWKTKWYEARMLASYIDDVELVTPQQMDAWCKDFDNWGICDTVCFKLFDRSPHAFARIEKWCKQKEEFVRRGGFALLACVALHQKDAAEEQFAKCLPLIEAASTDDRNFVKKSVNWALRSLGYVNSSSIREAARALANRLAASEDSTARWIGRDALKTLSKLSTKIKEKKTPNA